MTEAENFLPYLAVSLLNTDIVAEFLLISK